MQETEPQKPCFMAADVPEMTAANSRRIKKARQNGGQNQVIKTGWLATGLLIRWQAAASSISVTCLTERKPKYLGLASTFFAKP